MLIFIVTVSSKETAGSIWRQKQLHVPNKVIFLLQSLQVIRLDSETQWSSISSILMKQLTLNPESSVIVADELASTGLADAMDQIRLSGISKVSIAEREK